MLPLPTCDFDTALVVYRHVNVEGFIAHRLNFYSVPWSYIGQVLPVRITESEVIIYSIGLEEIARHPLRAQHADRRAADASRAIIPPTIPASVTLLLRQRFGELGPIAVQFLDGLLAKQIQGKLQAQQLLALVAHYQRDDVLEPPWSVPSASAPSPWPPCAASSPPTAKPKPLLDELAELHRDALDPQPASRTDRPTSDQRLSAFTLTRGNRR